MQHLAALRQRVFHRLLLLLLLLRLRLLRLLLLLLLLLLLRLLLPRLLARAPQPASVPAAAAQQCAFRFRDRGFRRVQHRSRRGDIRLLPLLLRLLLLLLLLPPPPLLLATASH